MGTDDDLPSVDEQPLLLPADLSPEDRATLVADLSNEVAMLRAVSELQADVIRLQAAKMQQGTLLDTLRQIMSGGQGWWLAAMRRAALCRKFSLSQLYLTCWLRHYHL